MSNTSNRSPEEPAAVFNTYYSGPVWEWFGLTRASYFVMPRRVLCSMPLEWQEKFVELVREIPETVDVGEGLDDSDRPGASPRTRKGRGFSGMTAPCENIPTELLSVYMDLWSTGRRTFTAYDDATANPYNIDCSTWDFPRFAAFAHDCAQYGGGIA